MQGIIRSRGLSLSSERSFLENSCDVPRRDDPAVVVPGPDPPPSAGVPVNRQLVRDEVVAMRWSRSAWWDVAFVVAGYVCMGAAIWIIVAYASRLF